MTDSKTYVFPDSGGGAADTNALLAAMNSNGGFGGGNWLWVLFLFFLYGWGGFGGMGGRGAQLGNQINEDTGRELLMQAINGNNNAIGQLATKLNCDVNAIQTAINGLSSGIQSVANNVGLSGQQIINAIQSGNATLASQLANCCCENRLANCQQTNTLTSRIDQLANGVQSGFASTAYESAQQMCSLQNTIKDSGTANTNAILAKLDQIENAALADKIAALTEKNSVLTTQLNLEHQNATFAAMLAPLQNELNAIKCAQPPTATIPYSPVVGVPAALAAQYGIGYGCGFGYNGNLWA